LERVLSLADPGSQSPKESWLRWVLVQSGLPRPQTQIPVLADDGFVIAYLDMGWPEAMVAVEYDGDHHRTDRYQYVKDIRRRELLERMGWIVITVVAEDRPADIVTRVRFALARR
jgi:very-short-patch-repair endonuclease